MLLTLALAAFGFVGALDQNVIVTALPRMLNDTGAPILLFSLHKTAALQFDRAGWLVTGYLLGYVAVLPLMGAVSDVHGRRQVMPVALLIFLGGSVAAAEEVLYRSWWWPGRYRRLVRAPSCPSRLPLPRIRSRLPGWASRSVSSRPPRSLVAYAARSMEPLSRSTVTRDGERSSGSTCRSSRCSCR